MVAVRVDPAAPQPAGAVHGKAVGQASISAPSPLSPSTTVAIRSDSLIRSSPCPADHRLPLGEAAEQCDQRQLVDRQWDLLGSHPVPSIGPSGRPGRHRLVGPNDPTGSPPPTIAPIRSTIRMNPPASS